MNKKEKRNIFYFKESRNELLKNRKICVLGYGSQGRAQALNLRDSGNSVVIGNVNDKFSDKAKEDGFSVYSFNDAIVDSDIIFLLLPDQLHKSVYENSIKNKIKNHSMIVVAHGYSLYFKELIIGENHDICLLAPRMPGAPIREQYLLGHGSPAFYSIEQNNSGLAEDILLKLADDLGYTKAGIMETSVKEETEIDLFIEQYFLPNFIGSIDNVFDYLIEEGFNPEIVLTELYASGEIGELLLRSAKTGIHKVWEQNASPTCRFGVMSNIDRVIPKKDSHFKMKETLNNIRSGIFKKMLDQESKINFKNLREFDDKNNSSLMFNAQKNLNKIFKNVKK